jgi:Icc-related predicted phosphoesterase
MRITHISDTHNHHNKLQEDLPGGDLLIHSGDLSSIGRRSEVERFIKWFNKIDNYTYKVFIAGNHDLSFESEALQRRKADWFDGHKEYDTPADEAKPQWLCELLELGLAGGVFYLENESITIDGVKIWGSPCSPTFGRDWAFNVNRGEDSMLLWNQIPEDTDIVITHGPIWSYCDKTYNSGTNVGCQDLFNRLCEVKPDLHFSGHIHEDYGYKQTLWGGYAFNGCSVSLEYQYRNKPISFDYDFKTKQLEFLM